MPTARSVTIAEGVEFDTVAREWRCKWSPDDEKASLVEAQKALESVLDEVKGVDGVKGVERIVCGGCLDFKVITSLGADEFGAWEEAGFKPEADFVAKLKDIDGISMIETQTFTVRTLRESFVHADWAAYLNRNPLASHKSSFLLCSTFQ